LVELPAFSRRCCGVFKGENCLDFEGEKLAVSWLRSVGSAWGLVGVGWASGAVRAGFSKLSGTPG